MSRVEPFPFVLDELQPVRPTVKGAFGFTYVYLDLVLTRQSVGRACIAA